LNDPKGLARFHSKCLRSLTGKLSGKKKKGTLPGCRAPRDADFSVLDVVGESLAELGVPVAAGLPSGHVDAGNVTLPLGVRARLEVGSEGASFELLEAGVA
jgi:muramoyltetrapeptide carboxypeptidase